MFRSSTYRHVSAFVVACLVVSAARAETPRRSVALFDGRSFTGWSGDTEHTWRIEDGTIVAGDPKMPAARNEFLATEREFEDFVLRYEYRIDATDKPNAGVQFRSRRIPDHHEVIGYQADIGPGITGALYDESRRRTFLVTPPREIQEQALAKAQGGWNTCVVRCVGPRIRIAVNDVETVDYTEPDPAVQRRGMIALQIHGGMAGTIRYRNITVVELAAADGATRRPPNVLMIAVDDLRPELGCYGGAGAVTPHLDRLAARGVRFDRAYCNIAVCGASRASLLKGLWPTPDRFRRYDTRADVDAPDVPSLPLVLKRRGYTTVSHGKVYHHLDDDVDAWSEPPWRPSVRGNSYRLPANEPPPGDTRRGPPWEAADAPDDQYPDHQLCSRSIADLERLARADAPFFLACGFARPHLPFVAPEKYWNLHPAAAIRLPDNPQFPEDLSLVFDYEWGELRAYRGIPATGPVDDETARTLIRGYRASVSFVDAQVGRLLDALDRLGLAENTIVVLWGDHGWQLGEHGMWCKHTNFEVATRTPLVIAAPGVAPGRACSRLVEFVDIYPTLCDLCGVPRPDHLQGTSLTGLLTDVAAPHKRAIFTRYGDGDAVRTDGHRLIEARTRGGAGEMLARGLFDLAADPHENVNRSDDDASPYVVLVDLLNDHRLAREGKAASRSASPPLQETR